MQQSRDSLEEKCGYFQCSLYSRIWVKIRSRSLNGRIYFLNRWTKSVLGTRFPHKQIISVPESKTVSASVYQDILYLKNEVESIRQSNNELKAANVELRADVAFLMDQNAKLMDQMEKLSNIDISSRTSDVSYQSKG